MRSNDALSIKNVKNHGMSTSKWTTKDKITQYKGLVTLYKRDRAIITTDTNVEAKKQYKKLVAVRKAIDSDRKQLDNALLGNKQQLRNVLADHKKLQLAYHKTEPTKVIDVVHQVNFTQRKQLDKMVYQMKLMSQQLTDLKLQKAVLEDRIKYEVCDKLKDEKEAEIVAGKVQDAMLKKEAALAIYQTYKQIINVMKKDALYFEEILKTIKTDYWYQCRCILNATKQGQLTTEYRNDREQEFETLRKAVLRDLRTQRDDLESAKNDAVNMHTKIQQLIRRDSDLTTCVVKVEDTTHFKDLKNDVDKIESCLTVLQEATLVACFDSIFPTIQEQKRQKKRLTVLVEKCEQSRDILQNKLNHAEIMAHVLDNTMLETTADYRKNKKELLKSIQEQKIQKIETDKTNVRRTNLLANVGTALRHLELLCTVINKGDKDDVEDTDWSYDHWDEIKEPENVPYEGKEIISKLEPKLSFLILQAPIVDDSKVDAAHKFYENLMKERTLHTIEDLVDESGLDEFFTEITQILTREDIKKQSDQIVALRSKQET